MADPLVAPVATAPDDVRATPPAGLRAPLSLARPSLARRLRGWKDRWLWAGLGLGAVAGFLPLSFTAQSQIMFNVAVQPPAAIVNSTAQLIASRELARDAVRQLSTRDVASLAAGGFPGLAAFAGDDPASEAARRLRASLDVTPVQGGRGIDITVSAGTPALAARAAEAYVAAVLALDSQVRVGPSADESVPLPRLRAGSATSRALLPEPPRPLVLLFVALGAGILLLARHHLKREPEPQGILDRAILPLELKGHHRITWLDGGVQEEDGVEAGLPLEEAVCQLKAHLADPEAASGDQGRLVLFTGDGAPDDSARCALAFGRSLAEDLRVAIVLLDRAATDASSGVPAGPGLGELLAGTIGFSEAIGRDPLSHAHLIAPGAGTGDMTRLADVLDALRRPYDLVAVAAPGLPQMKGAERLAALKPLTVCVHEDAVPPTIAVESFDALAHLHFTRVVMLRLATPEPEEIAEADSAAPVPTIEAAATPLPRPAPQPKAAPAPARPRQMELPLLAGAA